MGVGDRNPDSICKEGTCYPDRHKPDNEHPPWQAVRGMVGYPSDQALEGEEHDDRDHTSDHIPEDSTNTWIHIRSFRS